jgi:4-amino-4-deoxy-L-arabinose transferase-like glycosyltransferase
MLHAWLGLGESEGIIRALSAIFATATIPVLYVLARRLFGHWPALAATLLLAVNAYFVAHAQEARGYALSALLVTAASVLFVAGSDRPSTIAWALYAVVGAAAMYAHFFAAFTLLAHVLSAVFRARSDFPWRKALPAYAAIAVLVAPLLAFTLTNDRGQIDWIGEPTVPKLVNGLEELAGGAGPLLLGAYGLFVALTLVAMVVDWRRHGRSRDVWRHGFVLLWLVSPIVISFAVSFVKPIFQARYLLVAAPALVLTAASPLSALRPPRWLIAVAVAGAVALSASALPGYYGSGSSHWRDVTRQIVDAAERGDGLVAFAPTVVRPVLYHATRLGARARLPDAIYPPYGWLGFSRTRYEPNVDAIARRARRHERVWLVKGFARDAPRRRESRRLQHRLATSCKQIGGWARGTLVLFAC